MSAAPRDDGVSYEIKGSTHAKHPAIVTGVKSAASAGAPFGLFPPGPLWRPRRTIDGTPEMPDTVPPVV